MNAPFSPPPTPSTRQPAFNLPTVVTGLVAVLIAIHAGRVLLLGNTANAELILNFAFIPVRETSPGVLAAVAPWLPGARIWSFLTYAFLHGSWGHVLLNSLWLVAFGAPVGWRFRGPRFLAYTAVGAIAGAAFHMAFNWYDATPMIGASAGISAVMAGACRFAFTTGGPMWSMHGTDAYRRPAAPLLVIARDGRVIAFVVIWFGINLVFGLTGGAGLSSGAIAWDAHIGGFVAGLLLFPWFDPVPAQR